MEPASSFKCSQQPAAGPYREPDESSRNPIVLSFLFKYHGTCNVSVSNTQRYSETYSVLLPVYTVAMAVKVVDKCCCRIFGRVSNPSQCECEGDDTPQCCGVDSTVCNSSHDHVCRIPGSAPALLFPLVAVVDIWRQ
jgi:hypothetical protein